MAELAGNLHGLAARCTPADTSSDASASTCAGGAAESSSGLRNLQTLIVLRWIAVLGQVATIAAAQWALGMRLPLAAMAAVLAGLAMFNVASWLRWRTGRAVSHAELFFALLIDAVALALQLALSGGAGNPFVFLFLLQVVIGAVLLRPLFTWALLVATTGCIAALAVVSLPLALPLGDGRHGLTSPYIQGLLACFALNAALLVVFVTRIGRIQRERDAHLAALRERAAEQEHIMRMGLLASGAAHELGTPLSTLAVILGDWQHTQPFTTDLELRADLCEMQRQLARCKAIVADILASAGEAQGVDPVLTSVHAFIADVVQSWRALHPSHRLDVDNRFGTDQAIVSDTALRQMIVTVLDNAADVSSRIALELERVGDELHLCISDDGPGFPSAMLARFGAPYQSSKSSVGRGLGLFLAVNAARALGGAIHAHNRAQGGATVTIRLPLAAIAQGAGPA